MLGFFNLEQVKPEATMSFWRRILGFKEQSKPPKYPQVCRPTRVERHSSTKDGLYYWVQTDEVTGGGNDPKASVETRIYSILVPDGVSFEAAREQSLSFQEERKSDEHLLIQNRSEGYQIGRYVTHYPDGTLREVDIKYSQRFS